MSISPCPPDPKDETILVKVCIPFDAVVDISTPYKYFSDEALKKSHHFAVEIEVAKELHIANQIDLIVKAQVYRPVNGDDEVTIEACWFRHDPDKTLDRKFEAVVLKYFKEYIVKEAMKQ